MLSSRPVNIFGNTKTPGHGAIRSANHAENNINIFPSTKRPLKGSSTHFRSTSSTSSYKNTTDEDEYNEESDAVSPLKRAISPVKGSYSQQAKPFQDKTPFPNRTGAGGVSNTPLLHTPLPSVTKKFQFGFQPETFTFNLNTPALHLRAQSPLHQELEEEEEDSIASTPLPSSSRRQSRASRLSLNRTFETPQNDGRHWDVSDIDIELNNSLKIEEENPNAVTIDEEAEIEYMPPKVEVPYQPPFDFEFPDYKKLAALLFTPVDLDPKSVLGEFPAYYEPSEVPELETLERLDASESDSDIDDPFYHIRKARAAALKPTEKPSTAARPIPRSTSAAGAIKPRPVSVASRAPSSSTRPPSASSRPGAVALNTARSRPPSRPATVASHVKTDRFAGSHQTTTRITTSRSVTDLASQKKLASTTSGARGTATKAAPSSHIATASTLTRTQSTTLGSRTSRAAAPGLTRTRSATVTGGARAPAAQATSSRIQVAPTKRDTVPCTMPLTNAPRSTATGLKTVPKTTSGSSAKVPSTVGSGTAASRARAMTTSAATQPRAPSRSADMTSALVRKQPSAVARGQNPVEEDPLGLDLKGLGLQEELEDDEFLFEV